MRNLQGSYLDPIKDPSKIFLRILENPEEFAEDLTRIIRGSFKDLSQNP